MTSYLKSYEDSERILSMVWGETDYIELIDQSKSYSLLLLPYLSPYLAYVLFSSIPASVLSPTIAQGLKLLATSTTLIYFWKNYRFGPLKIRHAWIAIFGLPIALATWIIPFFILEAIGWQATSGGEIGDPVPEMYFALRLINSVVLVAVFEELFIRVYIMQWFFQASQQKGKSSFLNSLLDTFEQRPTPIKQLPLNTFSLLGASLVFAAGHSPIEYPSAILYFLFTTWLYYKCRSIWICIITHGLTNLMIALAVRYLQMGWLW
jgi:membrane protease YdiL (CAAX protease family)